MERGYIKLWRKSMDSRIYANKELWQLWTGCLMNANHSKKWVSMTTGRGHTEVEVLPGQFVFGRHTWAKKLNVKPSTLWKRMLKLKTLGFLNIQSNNSYSVITIVNWETYQHQESVKEQPKEQRGENQVNMKCKPSDTNKNNKNKKNDKNNKKKHKEYVFLTVEEYKKLIDSFGISGADGRIENLNDYIGSKGAKYKSHYHTILSWERKNKDSNNNSKHNLKDIDYQKGMEEWR